MCLAQFAISFDTCQAKTAKKETFIDGSSGASDMTIKSWNNEHETPLPEYYKLHEDLGYMKVRSNPSVFREFSFSEKNNAHEYYYSKLLLYWHWRKEENDFHLESAEQCSRLFATKAHEDDEKTAHFLYCNLRVPQEYELYFNI